jgi:hypothetical protein
VANYQEKFFYYQSPLNGVYKYYFDEKTYNWVNNRDDHLFIENMAREITKYCKGVLNL